MFQAVSKQSLSDVVYDQLRDRIVRQDLKAGEELPAERVLCNLLNVSRNAVREAIKRLQQAGLVQVRHGGATTVLDFRAEAGPELLPSLLVDSTGVLQVAVARSIVRMRQVLSPEIAADAATNGGVELADELDRLVQLMRADAGAAQLQVHTFAYWQALVDGSGNIAWQLAFNSLRKTYEPIWTLLTQVLSKELRRLDSFQQIAAAVRKADRARAHDCAKDYIDQSSQAIYAFLDAYEAQARGSERTS